MAVLALLRRLAELKLRSPRRADGLLRQKHQQFGSHPRLEPSGERPSSRQTAPPSAPSQAAYHELQAGSRPALRLPLESPYTRAASLVLRQSRGNYPPPACVVVQRPTAAAPRPVSC